MEEPPSQPHKIDELFETFDARKESRKSLLGFSLVYLSEYFDEPPATFHAEMVHALEDDAVRRLLMIGFRGSGKTKWGSLALPLWAALEYPEKYPFIVLAANTSQQGSLNLFAIKNELETNALIKQDYGEIKGKVIEDFSLRGEGDEWQKQNIVLSNGVRILATTASMAWMPPKMMPDVSYISMVSPIAGITFAGNVWPTPWRILNVSVPTSFVRALAEEINNFYLDRDFEMVVRRRQTPN